MQSNNGPLPFDLGRDYITLSLEWPKWKKCVELYMTTKKIDDPLEKKNMLLYCAGPDVQELFDTLPSVTLDDGEETTDVYALSIERLDKYFIRKINVDVERSKFRSMCQETGESIDKFIFRLRKQAQRCNFDGNSDVNIREQVIEKINNKKLQQHIFSKHQMSLDDIVEAAHAMEILDGDQPGTSGEQKRKAMEEINAVQEKNKKRFKYERSCFRCGRTGHLAKDRQCPAINKKCRKCQKLGHFAAVCNTKTSPKSDHTSYKKLKSKKIKSINEDSYGDDDEKEVFSLNGNKLNNRIEIEIGGISSQVMIDSGAQANVMDRDTWEKLKERKIKTISRVKGSNMQLNGYGATKSLNVIGEFTAKIKAGHKAVEAKFYVVSEKGCTLLGHESSIELGVLKVGLDINKVC